MRRLKGFFLLTSGDVGLTLNLAYANAIIMFSTGSSFNKQQQSQTLLLQTSPQYLSNQYVSQNGWNSAPALGVFIGKPSYQIHKISIVLGLSLQYNADIHRNGYINQLALSGFDNLDYQFDIQTVSAMATAHIHSQWQAKWQPYVDISLGASRNYAHNYTELPRLTGATPMPAFANKMKLSPCYAIAAGLLYQVS